jgi:UDP-N-acetylmuramoylalanine--D-glutamate ligase
MPPHNKLVLLNSKNIISDYDLFYDEMPFTIWISGTNGKTTTTQMCQYLLRNLILVMVEILVYPFQWIK